MVLGVQALPVRSEVAVLVGRQILFFSRHSDASASAAEDAAQSITMSTPCWSIHCRAMATATSGLFWLSADSTSTSKPPALNSCTACLVQITEVGPLRSRYGPDWSLITPILTTGLPWARARKAGSTAEAVAAESAARRVRRMWKVSLGFFCCARLMARVGASLKTGDRYPADRLREPRPRKGRWRPGKAIFNADERQ